MTNSSGRFRLSRCRSLCIDVLHYHQRIPICPHDRRFSLASVVAARNECPVRISWAVLFLKAYSLMALKHPEFRQCLLHFPWLHGYEHARSVGMLVLEREVQGERCLFWGRFQEPEHRSLVDLQEELTRYQTEPVKQIFKRQWQFSALPTLVRRLIWWWNLNVSGAKRAKRAGTFFLTTLAAKNTEITNPPAFHTGNLSYGPFDDRLTTRVTLSYDHRLIDGSLVADALGEMERVLCEELTQELESITASQSQRRAAA